MSAAITGADIRGVFADLPEPHPDLKAAVAGDSEAPDEIYPDDQLSEPEQYRYGGRFRIDEFNDVAWLVGGAVIFLQPKIDRRAVCQHFAVLMPTR